MGIPLLESCPFVETPSVHSSLKYGKSLLEGIPSVHSSDVDFHVLLLLLRPKIVLLLRMRMRMRMRTSSNPTYLNSKIRKFENSKIDRAGFEPSTFELVD